MHNKSFLETILQQLAVAYASYKQREWVDESDKDNDDDDDDDDDDERSDSEEDLVLNDLDESAELGVGGQWDRKEWRSTRTIWSSYSY